MVTIGMNYRVLPGKEETFEKACLKVFTVMESIEGHTASRLLRDVQDPQNFVILSEWTERKAYDDFISSEAFRRVADWGKEDILAGRPVHTCYEH